MELSKALADQITAAVYEVVKNDINLIDQQGIILSSTNRNRIGSFHEAGAQAVSSGQPVIVEQNNQYQGTHEGINYPIYFDGAPIAAIGITGSPDAVTQYGFLVTKITEVFLKEQQLNEEMLSENRSVHYLITNLIQGNPKGQQYLFSLLEKFGMDPADQFAILAIRFQDSLPESALRFYFSGMDHCLSSYSYPNEYIVLFDTAGLEQFQPDEFIARFHGTLSAGLGPSGPLHHLPQSWENAQIARKDAKNRGKCLTISEHISMELILESIPDHIRQMFAAHLLDSLSEKELRILKSYFEKNLSLKDTAEALFIHKNTLQYQLDGICHKCGMNPRSFQDAFLLQLALFCHTP